MTIPNRETHDARVVVRFVQINGVNTYGKEVTLVITSSEGRRMWLPASVGDFVIEKRATATHLVPKGAKAEVYLDVMGDFFSPESRSGTTHVTVQVQVDGKLISSKPILDVVLRRDPRFGSERIARETFSRA